MPKADNTNKKRFAITGDMIIGDVIRAFPETIEVFMQMGIHCVGCYVANFESIEEGIIRHGINPEKVIRELNKCIDHEKLRGSTASPKSRRQKGDTDIRSPQNH